MYEIGCLCIFSHDLHLFFQEQAQAKGWDKANKLEGRTTAQGLIGIQVLDDSNNSAVMVELNCETDFVARNKNFVSLLQHVTELNLKAANVTELDKVCTNYNKLLLQNWVLQSLSSYSYRRVLKARVCNCMTSALQNQFCNNNLL